jgi:hypothetical protein
MVLIDSTKNIYTQTSHENRSNESQAKRGSVKVIHPRRKEPLEGKSNPFRCVVELLKKIWSGILKFFNRLFHSEHHYVNTIYLGKFKHLTPEKIMDLVKTLNIFPMTVLDGDFKNVDSQAVITHPNLSFLNGAAGSANTVVVKEAGDTFITLEARANHLFRGTARHEIIKEGDTFYWQVTGRSPEGGEEIWRSMLNVLFSKIGMWESLVQRQVIPKLVQLDQT